MAAAILTDYMRPSCKRSFVKVLCYSLFPPCQPGKCPTPQLLCKEQCHVLRARTCSKEFRLLKTRLSAVADEIIPNCSKLPSFDPDCKRVPVGEFPQRNRELLQGQRRRQPERQKSNRFDQQNNNSARASSCFAHFFAVTARLRREVGLLYGGGKQKTTNCLFSFLAWARSKRNQFQGNSPKLEIFRESE